MAMRSNNPYIQHVPLIALDEPEPKRAPSIGSRTGSESTASAPKDSPHVDKAVSSPYSTASSSPGYNQFSGPTLFQPFKTTPASPPSDPSSPLSHALPSHMSVLPPAPSAPPPPEAELGPRLPYSPRRGSYQNSLRFGPRHVPYAAAQRSQNAPHLGGLGQPTRSIEIPRPPSILNPDPIPSHYRPTRRFPAIGETITEGQPTSPNMHDLRGLEFEPVSSKESVMRGQWTNNTAAVATSEYQPSEEERPMSTFSGMTAKLAHVEETMRRNRQPTDQRNPVRVSSDEFSQGRHSQGSRHSSGTAGPSRASEDPSRDIVSLVAGLFPALFPNHVDALVSFANYLIEDANAMKQDDGKSNPSNLVISRLHRWNAWKSTQSEERTAYIGLKSPDSAPVKEDSDDAYSTSADSQAPESDDEQNSKVSRTSSPSSTPNASRNPFHKRSDSSRQPEEEEPRRTIRDLLSGSDEDDDYRSRQNAPSPTPTDIAVAAAPKVDLVLQMPRPVPGVPTSRLDPGSSDFKTDHKDLHPDIDIDRLTATVSQFANLRKDANGQAERSTLEPPVLLKQAYAALDTACNNPSLKNFLADARKIYDGKQKAMMVKFEADTAARKARNKAKILNLAQTKNVSQADLDNINGDLEKDEVQRRLDFEREVYYIYERDYVEIAYKEVKAQLEVLATKWYEDVKHWLLHAVARADPATTNASDYRLFLDCLDLLNKFNKAMEDHERVLQNLVSDRNSRFLQISVAPLLAVNDSARYNDAQHRFWVDEQERLLVARNEVVKRARDYASVTDRIASDIMDRLKKRFESVVSEVNKVVLQFPGAVLPELFRRFFDYDTKGKTFVPSPNEFYTIPQHIVASLGDSVQVLNEITHLIKVSLDLVTDPQLKLSNANCALQASEDYARIHGLNSPQAMSTTIQAMITQRQPEVTKAYTADMAQRAGTVQDELLDVFRKLRAMVVQFAKDPSIQVVEVRQGSPSSQQWQARGVYNSGVSWNP